MQSRQFQTDQFIMPAYGSASFAEIPGFIRSLLTGNAEASLTPAGWERMAQRYTRVVTLFVDALGWRFCERFQDHPLLQRFLRDGSMTKLTSQFPSTTSAHVTTFYTGQPVGQHGVFEWFYYEPEIDAMIAPLLFSFAGDKDRETLAATGAAAEQLLPQGRVATQLAAAGASTVVFMPHEFTFSPYSKIMTVGADIAGLRTLPEGLVNLTQAMEGRSAPTWCVLYFDALDSVCHIHGPGARQTEAEIDALLTVIERWIVRDLLGRYDDTLLMVIADHGQIDVNPATTVNLNRLAEFDRLRPMLRTNRRGDILAPGGSPRDYFLYVKEGHVEAVQSLLGAILEGRAEVWTTKELIDRGLFGPTPISPALSARVGDLVVLPYAGESFYWEEKGRFEQKFYGYHGGLTRAEMEIPLLLLPIGA